MKKLIKLTLTILLISAASAMAQTQQQTQIVVADANGKTAEPMVIKNEAGAVITAKQAMQYCRTGNYKLVKAFDNNKKPYMLLKKAPGYSRPLVAEPVVVKP